MKTRELILAFTAIGVLAAACFAQATIVVNDPIKDDGADHEFTESEAVIFEKALVSVRKRLDSETCGESLQEAGSARGAFTRAGAKETLLFYEYCQTGNGLGWNGLVLIENGKITGNFVSDGGWGVVIGKVADVNRNGLDEFTLAYSGGMHQGQGGTGVDLMEFKNGIPTGIGWYKAEEFGVTRYDAAWKLTAKPGKVPVYYKQKFQTAEGRKPKAVGKAVVTKLTKTWVSKFEAVK